MAKHSGRLELTWTNKSMALLSVSDGKYDYTWVDPTDYRASEIRLLHYVDEIRCEDARPRGSALPQPTTGNLLITGDAMHALDSLASIPEFSDEFLGKIKMAYIDPPFNTGQAFDHYDDNIENSIWLTMLRDRIRQILPLLSDQGSVWVHLDDAQIHRCRSVLDEEMGIGNFVGTVVWQKADSTRNDAKGFSADQDYILVYRKSSAFRPERSARTAELDAAYVSRDGDPRPWASGDATAPGAKTHQGMVYGIQSPFTGDIQYPTIGRHWYYAADQMKTTLEQWGAEYELVELDDAEKRAHVCGIAAASVRRDIKAIVLKTPLEEAAAKARSVYETSIWPELFYRSKGHGGLGRKAYLPVTGIAPNTWWPNSDVGHNRGAKSEIKALFPGVLAFSTPKPEQLMEKIIAIASRPGDIVLDCFAGSGTTAAVAHKMGRRWITSELSPSTVEDFTKPRLTKVVRGEDKGGVSSQSTRVAASELPGGMSPEEAVKFNELLSKAAKAASANADEDLKQAIKSATTALRAATKTSAKTVKKWYGGGQFTHLAVGPSMFELVDDFAMIAEWAVDAKLAEVICAQAKVSYRPEGIFAGRRGQVRVMVMDAMVGRTTVEAVIDRLGEGEVVEIWSTQSSEEAEATLRKLRPGSSLKKIPDAVLDGYRQKPPRNARASEGTD